MNNHTLEKTENAKMSFTIDPITLLYIFKITLVIVSLSFIFLVKKSIDRFSISSYKLFSSNFQLRHNNKISQYCTIT